MPMGNSTAGNGQLAKARDNGDGVRGGGDCDDIDVDDQELSLEAILLCCLMAANGQFTSWPASK